MIDYVGVAERILREKTNRCLGRVRLKRLRSTDFTVISNNCWAGTVYRYFNLPYLSPTCGLYFFAEDYVRFASDLRRYVSLPLEFIDARDSSHYEELVGKGEENKVVAKIADIEVVFLHYSTAEEAEEKWRRRVERINWDNLFVKFSQMNGCSDDNIRKFDSIDFPNKICFTAKPMKDVECSVFHPSSVRNGQITNDTDRFRQNFDLFGWLNSAAAVYR